MEKLSGMENITESSILDDSVAIPPFSEKEAHLLSERLVADEKSRREAQQILISWMMQGECNKSNSTIFFNLIKLCLELLQKLKKEKNENEKKAEKAEKNLQIMNYLIKCELKNMDNDFTAMEEQGNWGSLTKTEKDLVSNLKENIHNFEKELMLDYVNNEIKTLKVSDDTENKFTEANCEEEISDLKFELAGMHQIPGEQQIPAEAAFEYNIAHEMEMAIVGNISIILFKHEFGLNLYAINDYLNHTHTPNATENEILFILRKYPKIFKEIESGQDHKWVYVAFCP